MATAVFGFIWRTNADFIARNEIEYGDPQSLMRHKLGRKALRSYVIS
jgi:hypothetical protein